MIPFRELDPDSLRRIVDLELQALTEREGFVRRNLELLVSDEAKQLPLVREITTAYKRQFSQMSVGVITRRACVAF